MGIDTSMLKYGKPAPRVVEKRQKRLTAAERERECREEVWRLYGRHCCVPGCREKATEQHHIVYRSRSIRLKYEPTNRAPLCGAHHQLLHAGKITIEPRNAGGILIIRGERKYLEFKL
jgi:predicted restriction endonuclease